MPDTVEGPLNDRMADAGKLYGDLYVILRQLGTSDETKLVPEVDSLGNPIISNAGYQLLVPSATVVGGEPVLTVIDPGMDNKRLDYGWYVEDTENPDGTVTYSVQQSPYPAQCVQPTASYQRWGDIGGRSGLSKNRLPLVITYDPTWKRSECEVGQLVSTDVDQGELALEINHYFIEPCDRNPDDSVIKEEKCQWNDPVNGLVTYPDGVLWTDLVSEVHFGRLNLGRSPEAVLQAAFDEAITNINSEATISIEIDGAGRLLLSKYLYEEFKVDLNTGKPLLVLDEYDNPIIVKKAIDSPRENLALYYKLMRDGHLVTPADEREPIDMSGEGGIPIWKLLELEDGPADAALRPTIDIAKMRFHGLGSLVDVQETEYLTYYDCLASDDPNSQPVPCLCWDEDPVQPERYEVLIACPNVVSRVLKYTTDDCPDRSMRTTPTPAPDRSPA